MNKTKLIFISHPNRFRDYLNKEFIKNQIYAPNTIAEESENLAFFQSKIGCSASYRIIALL